jgi:hypothetical protein
MIMLLFYFVTERFHLTFITFFDQLRGILIPRKVYFWVSSSSMRAWIPGVEAITDWGGEM